jgi:hypothetical protein
MDSEGLGLLGSVAGIPRPATLDIYLEVGYYVAVADCAGNRVRPRRSNAARLTGASPRHRPKAV